MNLNPEDQAEPSDVPTPSGSENPTNGSSDTQGFSVGSDYIARRLPLIVPISATLVAILIASASILGITMMLSGKDAKSDLATSQGLDPGDKDSNGIPDELQDENNDGIPDSQQLDENNELTSRSAEPAAPAVAATDLTGGAGKSAVWHYANGQGYSYDLRITVFPPATSGQNGDNPIGDACDFDPAVDIAVAGVLDATATTAGFDTLIRASFVIEHEQGDYTGNGTKPTDHDDRIGVEQYFNPDPKCISYSSTNSWGYGQPPAAGVVWDEPVAKGTTVRHRFTVIVKNYVSPRTPSGDTALLDWVTIRPMATAIKRVGDTDTYADQDGQSLFRSARGLTLSGNEVG